jgi:heterodisulfide reductase subunit A-like polyferredoxin
MVEIDKTLIVGGGIAGLTLAAALRAQGFGVDLIERNPNWQTLGAGMAIQPNAALCVRSNSMARSRIAEWCCITGVFAIGEVNCFAKSIFEIFGKTSGRSSE